MLDIMILYDVDGYSFLNEDTEKESANFDDWFNLVSYTYRRIFDGVGFGCN